MLILLPIFWGLESSKCWVKFTIVVVRMPTQDYSIPNPTGFHTFQIITSVVGEIMHSGSEGWWLSWWLWVKSANALCEPVADGKTFETGESAFVNIWKEKPQMERAGSILVRTLQPQLVFALSHTSQDTLLTLASCSLLLAGVPTPEL